MYISVERKFIFVHIPKVAGTSVIQALRPYVDKDDPLWLKKVSSKVTFLQKYLRHPPHLTAQQIRTRMGADVFGDYYKFAFVRNPWDWQVSLYHYMCQEPRHFQHKLANSFSGFEEYLQWRVKPENLLLQSAFITNDDGEVIVNYVGKLETIEDDFSAVCGELGVETKLPHLNKSSHKKYVEYYDDKTTEIVRGAFAKDIELFGYTFDDTR